MTSIDAHAPYATLINVFTVDPANAEELSRLLTAATEEVMCQLDGFISANIHRSTDGTRVVNYAQWDSAQAFQAMLGNPVARDHLDRAAELAVSYDPHLYTVDATHTR
ncbi:MAG: antibiotic biosynthesis monooxygenase family protein [Mycobacterium sp.]